MPRLVGLTRVRPLLDLATIAIGFAVLGVACGTGASPPPVPTVEPTVAPEPVAAVNPTGTVAPAAVAPAQAPASVFQFPATRTPRPTPTPIPRAEGDMTAATLYDHRATLLKDGRVLVTGGHAATTPFAFILAGVVSSEIYDPSTGRWSPTSPTLEGRRNHGGGPSRGRERAGLRRVDR